MIYVKDRYNGHHVFIKQERPDSCTIACARMVIFKVTSKQPTEQELRSRSQSYPGGYHKNPATIPGAVATPMARMGLATEHAAGTELGAVQKLLKSYNIKTKFYEYNSLNGINNHFSNFVSKPAIVSLEGVFSQGFGHAAMFSKYYPTPYPGAYVVCDPQFGVKTIHIYDADMPQYRCTRDLVNGNRAVDVTLRFTGALLQVE